MLRTLPGKKQSRTAPGATGAINSDRLCCQNSSISRISVMIHVPIWGNTTLGATLQHPNHPLFPNLHFSLAKHCMANSYLSSPCSPTEQHRPTLPVAEAGSLRHTRSYFHCGLDKGNPKGKTTRCSGSCWGHVLAPLPLTDGSIRAQQYSFQLIATYR